MSEELLKLLDFLTNDEKLIIMMRCGIGGYKEHNLSDISEKAFNKTLSTERVRAIESKAWRKLRNADKGYLLDKLL